jgi:hypothetical protein
MFLHNLPNVLIQIANKMGFSKKNFYRWWPSPEDSPCCSDKGPTYHGLLSYLEEKFSSSKQFGCDSERDKQSCGYRSIETDKLIEVLASLRV